MTNEEAINFLQNRIDLIDKYYPDVKDYREALVMAIEALEQEPCEDCISRQTVLDVLKEMWNKYSDANDAMQESIDTIEALPPITPQQKTGEWIDGKCSRCGTHAPYWAMASTYYCSDYCPNCGAKMQEVEE